MTLRSDSRNWFITKVLESVAVAAIVLVVFNLFVIRLSFIESFPAYEWDESVYFCIIENTQLTGQIRLVADELVDSSFYAFHPPFYFWLVSGLTWLAPDVQIMTFARIVNATAFGLAVAIPAALLLWRNKAYHLPVLCALLLVSFDAWVVLSNRTGWFENVQFLLVALTQIALFSLLTDGGRRIAAITGLLAGAVIVFKHIGAWIILQWVFLFVLSPGRRGLMLRAAAFTMLVIIAYGVTQYIRGGALFLDHTFHQFSRATGETEAPGVNISIAESLAVFREAYGIYWPSLLTTLIAGVIASYRLIGMWLFPKRILWIEDSNRVDMLLATWLLAAGCSLILIKLRNPHYYFLVFVPAALYLGFWIGLWLRMAGRERRLAYAALVLLTVGNLFALGSRVTWDDGVLTRYYEGPGSQLAGARVLTEEPLACLTTDIGAYRDIRLRRNRDEVLLTDGTLDAVVLLSSRTYAPAVSQEWRDVLESGWQQTYADSDWKWQIEIWRPKEDLQ